MQKAYNRIIWHNKPDTRSPINESNLNRMDIGLDTVDDRVITLDTTKANQTDLLTCVASIGFNQSTGILTITLQNGTSTTIDTGLSKLAVNFDYDDDPTSPHYEQLVLEMKDGTYKYIDLSALINQFEFDNTTTVAFTVDAQTGHISAIVPDGSITESKLQPNFLADCRTEKTQAQAARAGAETAESNAEGFKEDAEAWANGEINGVPVPDTHPAHNNNAKYYKDLANPTTFKALTDVDTDQSFVGIDLQGITDGQTMIFNNTSKKLVPGDSAGSFAQLKDVKLADTVSELDTIEYHLDYDTNKLVLQNKTFTRNMIKYPYNGADTTTAGVQIYADKDGSIHVEGTANDTITTSYQISSNAEASTSTVFCIDNNVYKFAADISGTITDGSSNPVPLSNYLWDASTVVSKKYGASSETFTLSNSATEVSVWKSDAGIYYVKNMKLTIPFTSGYTYNLVFKLSFFRAGIPGVDKRFNRHTMTNQELTDAHNVKDMFDTNINNPTPGQTLVYNSDGKIENATPSGSGHTILNSAGTALTPRTNLQFTGGLNATDDSNNNKSVVDDNYEIIPWTTWQDYSDAEKAQHPNAIVTDAPDCDGDVEIEFEKNVWTNPNTSIDFSSSQLTLDTDGNYDFLDIDCQYAKNTAHHTVNRVYKNQIGMLNVPWTSSSGVVIAKRTVTFNSVTLINISDCLFAVGASADSTNNTACIPVTIKAGKFKPTAKIKAIAHDVSTSASKCMLDENTSVADKLTAIPITFTPQSGYTLLYNNSRIVNGVFYIDLMLRASSSVTSRVNVGYFTNGSVSGYKRFTTYGSSSANGMLDRFTNGYINVNQLWIGDGATGGMIDIGLCIAIPV